MKVKYIIIFSVTIYILNSCSMVNWYRVYDQCQPCGGKGYVFQSDSSSFSLYLGGTQSFRMVGPAYIPLIPIPIGDSKRIWVFVYPKNDSLFHTTNAPEFALRPKGCEDLIRPVLADTSGPVSVPNQYRYRFEIGGCSPDTLEVVFLKKYLGYDLPKVTSIATKKMEYTPIEFPAH